jgi:hypothetical protein
MISASQLTPEQIETIKSWAENGARMADIQRRLGDELSLSATYMDTRFLMLDLGIELRDEAPVDEEPPAGGEPEPVEEPPVPEEATGPGGVSVQLDQITKPGAMVSGRITFSDGERGMWWIDSTGRPGLDTETAGYRPSEADLVAFQTELRRLLEGGA